jgi:hypothetical protein
MQEVHIFEREVDGRRYRVAAQSVWDSERKRPSVVTGDARRCPCWFSRWRPTSTELEGLDPPYKLAGIRSWRAFAGPSRGIEDSLGRTSWPSCDRSVREWHGDKHQEPDVSAKMYQRHTCGKRYIDELARFNGEPGLRALLIAPISQGERLSWRYLQAAARQRNTQRFSPPLSMVKALASP